MTHALVYVGLALLVLGGLCIFTRVFNIVACAVMALITGFLAIGHGLTELRLMLQRAGGRKARGSGSTASDSARRSSDRN